MIKVSTGTRNNGLLSLITTIYSFTEFFTFLSRLYERIATDAAIRVTVKLTGCYGRELATFDPMVDLFDSYVSREDTITQEWEVQVAELRASHSDIAREAVKHVFHVFNWSDVTDGTIVHSQNKLIKRTF